MTTTDGKTATDELRKLLDERGVKWWNSRYGEQIVFQSDGVKWFANDGCRDGLLELSTILITPEQAIAATLGSGTCKMEQIPECQFDDIACSECGVELWAFSMDKAGEGVIATPNYFPNCGRAVKQ